MELDKKIAKWFIPDDDSWLRHTNPWSIWTRFATLPFIVFAIWSRVWIGWYCLIPIALLIFWIWINPTLFGKPERFDNWGAKAVLGERVLMNRGENPISDGHSKAVFILNVLQFIGVVILGYGLWTLSVSTTLHGMSFVYLTKMWFLDRMVWLYEQHATKDEI